MRCFFEMDDAIQTFDQAIKWFQEHKFDRNATLVLNEDMFASHVDLAIYGYEHRDHLAIPLTKTWTEILSHHNTHPTAVWLLSKEQEANGNQIHAIPNVRKAIALGSTEAKDFMSKTLTEEAIQIAKSEQFAGGENDTEIIEASILYKDVPQLYKNIPISEDSLRLDFGFAKWIIRYNRQLCDLNHLNTESLMSIMEYYGLEGLMWLGDELRGTTDYVRIQCYKKAAELGHDRAKSIVSKYREEVTGETIPDVKINEFLKDPWTLPKLDECITNADIRSDFKNLFKIVGTILTDNAYKEIVHYSDVPGIIQRGLDSIKFEQNNTAMSEHNSIKNKWISVEIEFINALKKWYETDGANGSQNIIFQKLATKEYTPAKTIFEMERCFPNKDNLKTYPYYNKTYPYYNNMMGVKKDILSEQKLKEIENSSGWSHQHLYKILIRIIKNFKEYRKNQYQDV